MSKYYIAYALRDVNTKNSPADAERIDEDDDLETLIDRMEYLELKGAIYEYDAVENDITIDGHVRKYETFLENERFVQVVA